MTQENLSFSVITGRGPSKFDLMLSLFDGNKEPRRTVEFDLGGTRGLITVAITMIQQEDGSGESWNFEGWITNYRRNFGVKGYYSSKGRTGCITFVVPFHYEWRDDTQVKIETQADQREMADYIEWLRGKGTGWPVPSAHVYTTHHG